MKKLLSYFIIFISLFISCGSQNVCKSDINPSFTEQFFMNQNVYRVLKKYAPYNTINIIDPDHNITNEFLKFKNNDLTINIDPERKNEYDFFIKKVVINKSLAFIVLWYKDTTTALCFYPAKSERTVDKWIIEEITTKSIK